MLGKAQPGLVAPAFPGSWKDSLGQTRLLSTNGCSKGSKLLPLHFKGMLSLLPLCFPTHLPHVNVGSLQPPILGSSQTLTREVSVSPGSGLSQALAEESGSWSHLGVGLWPWPQAAAFPWDQLMDQGMQRSLHELQSGREGTPPQNCSLFP